MHTVINKTKTLVMIPASGNNRKRHGQRVDLRIRKGETVEVEHITREMERAQAGGLITIDKKQKRAEDTTPVDETTVIELLKAGKTQAEVANLCNLSKAKIRKIARSDTE